MMGTGTKIQTFTLLHPIVSGSGREKSESGPSKLGFCSFSLTK